MIYKLRDLIGVDALGGTMRLGKYPCNLREGSIAREAYGTDLVEERHRHRFEANPEYMPQLEERGFRVTGLSPDGKFVEIIELEGPPLVRRLPVPSRVSVAPHRAAPVVPFLHRRRARVQELEQNDRADRATGEVTEI